MGPMGRGWSFVGGVGGGSDGVIEGGGPTAGIAFAGGIPAGVPGGMTGIGRVGGTDVAEIAVAAR